MMLLGITSKLIYKINFKKSMIHKYILVRMPEYLIYQEKYGHVRLDRSTKIWSAPKNKIFGSINEEEIFDGIETKYSTNKQGNNYLVEFKTNSNTEYRFDLLNEPNTKVYHLAFSLFSNVLSDETEYHRQTNKGESLEVINRLIYILKELDKKLDVDQYCIGATGNDKKDHIYEYLMRFITGWEKKETDQYQNGWGIYFKL